MSVQNRVFNVIKKQEKTELSTQKVEFKIGDGLDSLISQAEKSRQKLNKELDDAFTPIRQIEKLADQIYSKIDGFSDFTNSVQKLEVAYQNELQKLRNIENELGQKVDFPKSLGKALTQLEELQSEEEYFRREINEFNQAAKKYR